MIRVEPDGGFKVETWNAAAEGATGLPASAVLGRSPSAVFPGARGEAIERDLRRTLTLGRVQTIEREPKINGLPTVFEMVQVPLRGPDGAIERIFLSARDISERKRVERLKNEFVSTVSHELRTPLTSIAGSLGLLVGGAAGAMPRPAQAPLDDRAYEQPAAGAADQRHPRHREDRGGPDGLRCSGRLELVDVVQAVDGQSGLCRPVSASQLELDARRRGR